MRDYPRDWDRIARAVKDAAGWRCENPSCRHPHDPSGGYTLTVHHKDGDPANCHPDNMAALCQRCHLKAQARLRLYGPEDDRQLRFRFYAPEKSDDLRCGCTRRRKAAGSAVPLRARGRPPTAPLVTTLATR